MKHNISITVDQKLFRQLENIRGREKRSTLIEHLIIQGLKTYNPQQTTPTTAPYTNQEKKKKELNG